MAKKQAAKAAATTKTRLAVARAGAAGDVAEVIGESLADLMNRKDALVRQLTDVNRRIASASQAGSRLMQAVPNFLRLGRPEAHVPKKTRAAGSKTGNGKRKRPAPPDQPMVAQTERTRAAEAKARAARRARTAGRSGNR